MPAPAPDISQGLKPADIAAFGRVAEATPVVKGPNLVWAEHLSDLRQSQEASSVIHQIAERDAKPQYNAANGQQDIARLGGGAGHLDKDGKAQVEARTTQAQKESFEQGRQAVENASAVMFCMDILALPPADRAAAFAKLQAENPSFKALGLADVPALEARALTAMNADPDIKLILDSLPLPGQPAYTQAERNAIIRDLLLTDKDFSATLRQNFQQVHERLTKLPAVTPEGTAQLQADKAQAERETDARTISLRERINRDPSVATKLTEAQARALLNNSGNEADFRRNLAVQLGVDATHVNAALEYQSLQQQIASMDQRITDAATRGIHTKDIDVLKAQRADLVTKQGDVVTASGRTEAEVKADVAICDRAAGIAGQQDVRTDVQEGINASIRVKQLDTEIKKAGGGNEASPGLTQRLDQERQIIDQVRQILSKSLAQTYVEREDQMKVLREKAVQEAIKNAGSQAEKDLIIAMETTYVSYDIATREKTIHGDEIMQASKLMSMGDRGLRVLMARDMHLAEPAGTTALYDAIFTAADAPAQQRAINTYLDAVTGDSAKQAVLDKAIQEKGGAYRQKVLEGYYTMRDYLKEGFFGNAIRVGKKLKYEGSGKGIRAFLKGESGLNATELQNMYNYCKADVDAAIKNNAAASRFIERMKSSGQIADMGFLKFLTWFLVIICGAGGTAIAGPLGGGIGAALGGGAKAGLDRAIST